ncbi:M42 family metallopeptidase [Paenibacillus aurantius]|uniref:M42 family metallopeptidase n=1 Tax=Paenibacillus aurantius TaxID=2918900 RepID=A0AA96LHA4_9BACL|nr:M42 family metallopeptidase [Paenibacillus aurantius]WNQ13912.1 M42 family metallopeptidase [Paenibacillus aurantius]
MDQTTRDMFRTLTELPGAPGFEHEVRRFLLGEIKKHTGEIVEDRLGSLFGVLRGDPAGPRIMAGGHMDEVGFLVTTILDNGMVRFQALGGWWNQVLLAQRMTILTPQGPVLGVISSTPRHLLDEAQRSKPVDIPSMYLDIGADNRQHAQALGVRPGLPIVPVSEFTPLANEKKILAKAWDNRFGVGLAIELLRELKDVSLPNTLYAGATVQEEVGMRGAQTAAALIEPDLCYTLEAGPAGDAGGDPNAFGRLGQGAVVRILDSAIIPNRTLTEFILDTAETHRIPYQLYISPGATDGGKIHLYGRGVPTAVLGVCARYIHTSASMIHTDDYEAAKELLLKLIQASDKSMYESVISF